MTPASERPLTSIRTARVPCYARGVLLACMLVCSPARLEPVRWWWSPGIASALAVTPAQSRAIEGLYEGSMPASRFVSEEVIRTTEKVARRLRDGAYDDELLNLTGELVNARRRQCELRRRLLDLSTSPLSPRQREKLMRLIRERRVME